MTTRLMKILLCGDGGVGKTSLREQFLGKKFKESYMKSIGAEFALKDIEILSDDNNNVVPIKIQVWDIAGQDLFEQMRPSFYKGAVGACFVYDITKPSSFEHIHVWLEEILTFHSIEFFPVVLLGNKIDLRAQFNDTITTQQGVKLSKELTSKYYVNNWKVPLIETSAKTGDNVDLAFMTISKAAMKFQDLKLAKQ